MILECPRCGSDEVRLSRRRRAIRTLLKIFGIYTFRCQSCQSTFQRNIGALQNLAFAKCSLCHRMDLSRWSRDYYNPSTWTKLMLAFGAKPVRCEYCRNNFWSFRLVKEKFSKEKRAARSRVIIPVSTPSSSALSEATATDSESDSAKAHAST
jgi:DNA-directed RNA polymerase subunit RPC12/RpoP